MATEKKITEDILEKITVVANARIRPMFGEYILYVDEKVVGQINENKLYIKVTSFGEKNVDNLEKASPYPGAKPAFIVPQAKIEDKKWLASFLHGTRLEIK